MASSWSATGATLADGPRSLLVLQGLFGDDARPSLHQARPSRILARTRSSCACPREVRFLEGTVIRIGWELAVGDLVERGPYRVVDALAVRIDKAKDFVDLHSERFVGPITGERLGDMIHERDGAVGAGVLAMA
jgi:hypothetical protein